MTIPTLPLNSGAEIPAFGLGTWELLGDTCTKAVKIALDLGYNHIDTAFWYGNHLQIAPSIKGVDRESFFITTKIPPFNLHYNQVIETTDQSLTELGIDYVDLLLLHWPNRKVPMAETFGALKAVHDAGKARNIGVSNYSINHLRKALQVSELPVTVNQVEYHPLFNQQEMLTFCRGAGIVVEAYSPLGRGDALKNPVIGEVAARYGKTPAQVIIRWFLQKDVVVIPKASSEPHLRDNLGGLGWEMAEEDCARIDALDEQARIINPDFGEWNIAIEDIA